MGPLLKEGTAAKRYGAERSADVGVRHDTTYPSVERLRGYTELSYGGLGTKTHWLFVSGSEDTGRTGGCQELALLRLYLQGSRHRRTPGGPRAFRSSRSGARTGAVRNAGLL